MSIVPVPDFSIPVEKQAQNPKSMQKLLLVEDDRVNQMLSRKMLLKAGFEVDVANDGLEAKKLLACNLYHLVITDIKTPNMDGYALTKHIRDTECLRNLPVIAVSAYPSSIEKQKALEAGMNEYIAKPYGMHELVETIKLFL
ncbi:MAG: response regulator [Bacteroidia bacterium]|nr:response regulator [Bacteroidia bacterium]HQU99658.1 response regulator [Bacteroidia bacterium]